MALLVLFGASLALYHSLEADRLVERARQEWFMRSAGLSVVDDLGGELFTMYSAFSLDLYARKEAGAVVDRRAVAAAVERYKLQARFPDLLQDLTCLISQADGTLVYASWSERGWAEAGRPDWSPELSPPVPGKSGEGLSRTSFSLSRPVLTMVLRSRPRSGEVVAIALRFSPRVVLEEVWSPPSFGRGSPRLPTSPRTGRPFETGSSTSRTEPPWTGRFPCCPGRPSRAGSNTTAHG